MTDSDHTTTLPHASDSHLSALLESLVEDDKRHNAMVDAGTYTPAIEEERNDTRATKERQILDAIPTTAADIVAQLRVVWSEMAIGCSYFDPPDERHDTQLHRLWAVIQGAQRLAELGGKTKKPSTTGLLEYYQSEAKKAGF